MSKPASQITFATDAAYTTGPRIGDATKITPTTARLDEGYIPDELPGEWLNWQLNTIGAHVSYIHGVLEGTDSIPASSVDDVYPPSVFNWQATAAGSDMLYSVAAAGTGNRMSIPAGVQVLGQVPLNALFPVGAIITGADLLLTPGTHSVAGRFSLHTYTPNFATPAAATHTESTGVNTSGTAAQKLSLSGSWTRSETEVIYLQYDPGTITSGADLLEALQITWTPAGPR